MTTLGATPNNVALFLNNANTADVTLSSVDTYLTGSALAIGGFIKAGLCLSWRFVFSKTAAGVATPIFAVRFGTGGTTSDTARVTYTLVAQTGAVDKAVVDIEAIIRNTGASSIVASDLVLKHSLTTTGFSTQDKEQIQQVNSSAFDTTSGSLIAGVSCNPGASGVWTCQIVMARAFNLLST